MTNSIEIIQVAAFLGAGIAVSVSSIAAGIGEGYVAGEAVCCTIYVYRSSSR